MTDRTVLLLAALGLVPIALSYGLSPGTTLPFLLGFPVEGLNQTHIFRAIMGLYFANVGFWIAGYLSSTYRVPALWSLFIFMSGLAAGRVLSLLVDGFPGPVLIFYLLAEIAFAVLALRCLRKSN